MNIGIYGGSFNPIHRGHTALAESIVSQGLVDELWLMVSPLNPLKSGAEGMADYVHRLRMAQLATDGVAGVRASDFESRLPLPSYTIRTLDALSAAHPQHTFTLVIGADNWLRFPRWYHADEIVRRFAVLVFRRPGCEIDEASLPPSVRMVSTPLYDISSTRIREDARRGQLPDDWLDTAVADHIRSHRLYGCPVAGTTDNEVTFPPTMQVGGR